MDTPVNRRSQAISNTPGTSGNFVLGSAAAGYAALGASHDGLSFAVLAKEGSIWEVRTGCTYTHSSTTLTRGTLEESSSGSAVSFTSAATVSVIRTAAQDADVESRSLTAAQRGAVIYGGMYAAGRNTICAIGDSQQALGFTLSSAPQTNVNSALNWGLVLLKQALWLPFGCSTSYASGPADIVNYCLAVTATTTQDAIDSQIGPAAALGAGWWSVLSGTNDVVLRPADSVVTICNRIRTICQAGLAAGARIALWTLPPRNDSSGAGSWSSFSSSIISAGSTVAAQRLKHMAVNQWIRRYAQETAGVVLIDPFAELVDPASATGDWLSGYAGDAVHWNNKGAFIAGQVFANAMRPFVKTALLTDISQTDVYDATNNPGGNLAMNYGFQGSTAASGTGISGTMPTGWTIDIGSGSATVVGTVQARTDTVSTGALANGRELQLAVSTMGAASQVRAYPTTMAVNVPANVPFCIDVEFSVSANSAAWYGPSVQQFFNSGAVPALAFATDSSSLPVGATFDGVLRTPISKHTSAAGGLVLIQMNGTASSAATMKIRRINVRALPASMPGLILGAA